MKVIRSWHILVPALLLAFCLSGQSRADVAYSSTGSETFAIGNANNFPIVTGGKLVDGDGGCDTDTGAYGCGDSVSFSGASGTIGAAGDYVLGTFSLHIEDSKCGGELFLSCRTHVFTDYGFGSGDYQGSNSALTTTLTIDGVSATLNLPYTIIFGSNGDQFGFDANVVLGQIAANGAEYLISTSDVQSTLGSDSNDDDFFFNGALDVSIQELPLETTSNNQPVPEPGSSMLMGAGLAALGFLRRRRKV